MPPEQQVPKVRLVKTERTEDQLFPYKIFSGRESNLISDVRSPEYFIGTYVDYTEPDSTDPSKYTWYRFKGLQGEQGTQGTQEPMVQMGKHHTCTLNNLQ